jgi:hypothetical protein
MLIGSHYFPPDAKPENIANYFRFLENHLDTHNFRVIMVGPLVSTGKVICLCQIPIIILNLRETRFTPPRVFLTLTSGLIISIAAIYLI